MLLSAILLPTLAALLAFDQAAAEREIVRDIKLIPMIGKIVTLNADVLPDAFAAMELNDFPITLKGTLLAAIKLQQPVPQPTRLTKVLSVGGVPETQLGTQKTVRSTHLPMPRPIPVINRLEGPSTTEGEDFRSA